MIDMRKFYLVGGILFIIVVLANSYSLVVTWGNLNIGAKVSSIAGGLLFNLLLCLMFFSLYKMTPNSNMNIAESPDLDSFLQEVQKDVP